MPPKAKFQKEEIVCAALRVAARDGADAVTAREVARELGVSVGPIFTYFDTMDALKAEVYARARERYRAYIERGLSGPIPFLGMWQQYLVFAGEEPELYRLLFHASRQCVRRCRGSAAVFAGPGAAFDHARVQHGRGHGG